MTARACIGVVVLLAACAPQERIVVGSKGFTESVILGEVLTQSLRMSNVAAEHRAELGGSRVLFEALLAGQIDLYPEYTGTLRQELLAGEDTSTSAQVEAALARRGLAMSAPLGFNNTYAIGVRREVAERLGLRQISDLARHPELRLGFSNEFLARADGWPALRQRYALPHTGARGMDHDLIYPALESGALDAADLYSTDAEVQRYDLVVLEDDLNHFPEYQAVVVFRADLATREPDAIAAIARLKESIAEAAMIELNARAKLERESPARVASDFLARTFGIKTAKVVEESLLARVLRTTRDHLVLVGISLGLALLLAVPLGVVAAKHRTLGRVVLTIVGVVQTIPSLALLVLMIPFVGIGTGPAVVALVLYALLPMVRGTHAGLVSIPLEVTEAADALGLPAGTRLRRIELPMASQAILSGIKTSAVITVGTATLGALVGAGGYGQPILTGVRLADAGLMLEGAFPAAVLAILVQGLFGLIERRFVPQGLRL